MKLIDLEKINKENNMNNSRTEATRELCNIIAYEADKSPLRWTDVRDDSAEVKYASTYGCNSIYIYNLSPNTNTDTKVCKVRIYVNSLRCSKNDTYYYVYFTDKYSSVAKDIKDPRIAGITDADGYKFVSPRHVIDFVREVVRWKERGGVLKDCKTEVVDRMERTKEVLMKKYKNAPHFKVNSITYSTGGNEVNAIQRQYMTIEAEILPGAYFTTAPKVELINAIQSIGTSPSTDIKDVIFNDPATIIIWADGSKTVVKAENEAFDPEKGLAMAISKKMFGNKYDYYEVFKKYVGKYEKKKLNKKDKTVTMPKSLADTWKAQDKVLRNITLNTVKNLRAEGKSLAEIAKIMGYDDPAVVRSILPDEEDTNT